MLKVNDVEPIASSFLNDSFMWWKDLSQIYQLRQHQYQLCRGTEIPLLERTNEGPDLRSKTMHLLTPKRSGSLELQPQFKAQSLTKKDQVKH